MSLNNRSLQLHSSKKLIQLFLSDRWFLKVFLIVFILVILRHLQGRLEDIDRIDRSAANHLIVNRMKTDLLDLFLSLMQK